jgi:hypothetical protein
MEALQVFQPLNKKIPGNAGRADIMVAREYSLATVHTIKGAAS